MTDQPEIAACPCGCACEMVEDFTAGGHLCWWYECRQCGYRSTLGLSTDEARFVHNRIATAIPLERVREVLAGVHFAAVAAATDGVSDLFAGAHAIEQAMNELGITMEQPDAARAAQQTKGHDK